MRDRYARASRRYSGVMLAEILMPADSGEIELGHPELLGYNVNKAFYKRPKKSEHNLALQANCVELGTSKLNCGTN